MVKLIYYFFIIFLFYFLFLLDMLTNFVYSLVVELMQEAIQFRQIETRPLPSVRMHSAGHLGPVNVSGIPAPLPCLENVVGRHLSPPGRASLLTAV